jgi:hypothetical protein
VKIYTRIIGDLVAAMLLLLLGVIGIDHDNKHYLRNGRWHEYDQYDEVNWLMTEIEAGILMLVSL